VFVTHAGYASGDLAAAGLRRSRPDHAEQGVELLRLLQLRRCPTVGSGSLSRPFRGPRCGPVVDLLPSPRGRGGDKIAARQVTNSCRAFLIQPTGIAPPGRR
jgi:hypothetical protein